MELILLLATLGVLTFLGVSCHRARLELEEQVCECLDHPLAAAVGYRERGLEPVPARTAPPERGRFGAHPAGLLAPPVLIGLDGGRQTAPARPANRDHLRVVRAG